MPTVYILYLIQEQIRDIRPIKLIYARKNGIQITRFHPKEPIIVKIDVTIPDAMFQQHFVAQSGLSTATYADDNLSHRAVKLE